MRRQPQVTGSRTCCRLQGGLFAIFGDVHVVGECVEGSGAVGQRVSWPARQSADGELASWYAPNTSDYPDRPGQDLARRNVFTVAGANPCHEAPAALAIGLNILSPFTSGYANLRSTKQASDVSQ